MARPLAVVTGVASGIGLAVTKHLLGRGYRVAMADVNEEEGQRLSSELRRDAKFFKTDVCEYLQLASTFKEAFEFGGERLDLIAVNTGIDDCQDLYQSNETMQLDKEGLPVALNLKTIRVNLDAVLQALWLFKHFNRRSQGSTGGQVVITSSAAGLYPMPIQPQYTASKHALVGLTRAAGPIFFEKDRITVNCICPAFIETNLCPPHIKAIFPKEHITPMSTVLKAFDTFIDNPTMTGQTLELSLENIYFRKQPDWSNESQRFLGEGSADIWEEGYKTPAKLEITA